MKLLLSFILPSASKVRTPFENFQHIIFAVPTYSNVTDGLVVLGDRLLFQGQLDLELPNPGNSEAWQKEHIC